jgi:hypothetical protein
MTQPGKLHPEHPDMKVNTRPAHSAPPHAAMPPRRPPPAAAAPRAAGLRDGLDPVPAAVAGKLPEPLLRLRSAVSTVLARPAETGPWTDPEGMCLDLAAKWQPALLELGVPARIATTDPSLAGGKVVVDGQERHGGKFHAYVVVDGGPQGELIVDPSFRQFFDPKRLGAPVPDVFVGTHAEAAALFARERQALRVELHEDPHQGRYEPASFASLTYATSRNAALRMTLE